MFPVGLANVPLPAPEGPSTHWALPPAGSRTPGGQSCSRPSDSENHFGLPLPAPHPAFSSPLLLRETPKGSGGSPLWSVR